MQIASPNLDARKKPQARATFTRILCWLIVVCRLDNLLEHMVTLGWLKINNAVMIQLARAMNAEVTSPKFNLKFKYMVLLPRIGLYFLIFVFLFVVLGFTGFSIAQGLGQKSWRSWKAATIFYSLGTEIFLFIQPRSIANTAERSPFANFRNGTGDLCFLLEYIWITLCVFSACMAVILIIHRMEYSSRL